MKDQFTMDLNTAGQAVNFTVPTLTTFDPGLAAPATAGPPTINIPAGPVEPSGAQDAAAPYLEIAGSGGIGLANAFTLVGSFNPIVSPCGLQSEVAGLVQIPELGSLTLGGTLDILPARGSTTAGSTA